MLPYADSMKSSPESGKCFDERDCFVLCVCLFLKDITVRNGICISAGGVVTLEKDRQAACFFVYTIMIILL